MKFLIGAFLIIATGLIYFGQGNEDADLSRTDGDSKLARKGMDAKLDNEKALPILAGEIKVNDGRPLTGQERTSINEYQLKMDTFVKNFHKNPPPARGAQELQMPPLPPQNLVLTDFSGKRKPEIERQVKEILEKYAMENGY
jgi:hypothetical protein